MKSKVQTIIDDAMEDPVLKAKAAKLGLQETTKVFAYTALAMVFTYFGQLWAAGFLSFVMAVRAGGNQFGFYRNVTVYELKLKLAHDMGIKLLDELEARGKKEEA
jgi:hypothetical protein